MDMVERYLAAIARQLPDAQKADVTGELRDVLLSRIEDREVELGRALTGPEVEAQLIDFGHPLTVSGRYRKIQHLIGPEIFPFWWASLKISLAIVVGVYVVLAILAAVGGEDLVGVSDRTESTLTAALLLTLGAVTLVFALIERFGKAAILNRWKPRQLPPARPAGRTPFELSVDIAVGVVFIAWWTGTIQFRSVVPDTGLRLDLAPIWQVWFWPILANSVLEVGAHGLALARPGLVRIIEGLLILRSLTAAAILGAIYQAGRWVDVASATLSPDALALAQTNVNTGMRIGIGFAILVFLVLAGVSVWRLRRAMAHTI